MQKLEYILISTIAFLLMYSNAYANISCPPMPDAVTSVNKDFKSEISASVGSLGKIKAGDISVKTEIQANNLFAKYPNVDKLLALQTMSATYCEMLSRSSIPEAEKLNRWEKFQDKVLDLKVSTSQTNLLPPTPRTTGEKVNAPSKSFNAKNYPLLAGLRVGLMYVERQNKYMTEVKDRLTKVGAIVITNEVTDWKGYPEYVGRLLYNPANLEAATQLKTLVSDVSSARFYETREIFDKYDLVIWMDSIK